MTVEYVESCVYALDSYLKSQDDEERHLAAQRMAVVKELVSRVDQTQAAAKLGISRQRVSQIVSTASADLPEDHAPDRKRMARLPNLDLEVLVAEFKKLTKALKKRPKTRHKIALERALRLRQLCFFHDQTDKQPPSSLSKAEELDLTSDYEGGSVIVLNIENIQRQIREHGVAFDDPIITRVLRCDDKIAASAAAEILKKFEQGEMTEDVSENQVEQLRAIATWSDPFYHSKRNH